MNKADMLVKQSQWQLRVNKLTAKLQKIQGMLEEIRTEDLNISREINDSHDDEYMTHNNLEYAPDYANFSIAVNNVNSLIDDLEFYA